MSLTAQLIKIAIKLTPNFFILCIANIILRGIAKLSDFIFDIDTRSLYVRLTLLGEIDAIEVSVNGFSIMSDENSHHLIIQQAESNRLWLNNIFSRIVGKAWKIPELPKYKNYIDLLAELFKTESVERIAN